eukprot:6375278-Prymnesium_polylepis.1
MVQADAATTHSTHRVRCSESYKSTPQVAICLGGAVRTFTHPALMATWLDSLIHGFSGANVTAFGYIKAGDLRGEALSQALKTPEGGAAVHRSPRQLAHWLNAASIPANRLTI